MAFEGVQDGELARVFQGEDDDFACVVKPWSSCYEQTALFGWHHRRHCVTWLWKTQIGTPLKNQAFLEIDLIHPMIWVSAPQTSSAAPDSLAFKFYCNSMWHTFIEQNKINNQVTILKSACFLNFYCVTAVTASFLPLAIPL